MKPVIRAHSENVFLCGPRPGAGSLNHGTFTFRYLLLKFRYGINYYTVLSFLKNQRFMMEKYTRNMTSLWNITSLDYIWRKKSLK